MKVPKYHKICDMLGLQRVLHVLCQCHLTCAVYGQTVDKPRQLVSNYIVQYWTFDLVLLSKTLNQLQTKARTESNVYQAALMHCYAKPKNEGEFMRIEVQKTTPSAIAKFKTWSCWWLEAFLLRTSAAALFFFMLGSSRSCQFAVSMCPDPSSSWSVQTRGWSLMRPSSNRNRFIHSRVLSNIRLVNCFFAKRSSTCPLPSLYGRFIFQCCNRHCSIGNPPTPRNSFLMSVPWKSCKIQNSKFKFRNSKTPKLKFQIGGLQTKNGYIHVQNPNSKIQNPKSDFGLTISVASSQDKGLQTLPLASAERSPCMSLTSTWRKFRAYSISQVITKTPLSTEAKLSDRMELMEVRVAPSRDPSLGQAQYKTATLQGGIFFSTRFLLNFLHHLHLVFCDKQNYQLNNKMLNSSIESTSLVIQATGRSSNWAGCCNLLATASSSSFMLVSCQITLYPRSYWQQPTGIEPNFPQRVMEYFKAPGPCGQGESVTWQS